MVLLLNSGMTYLVRISSQWLSCPYIYNKFEFNMFLLLAHMSTECSVGYCDHSPSVGVRPSDVHPSVHNFLVNTLASSNINQSAPNLVKVYMTIRFWMSLIMELIRPELSELPLNWKICHI